MSDQGAANGTLGRAVVLGAGIGGLVAARVLSDHFDQVTIVEQDHLPEGPEGRTGAPQAQHLHVLLQRGKLTLEALFPGLQEELAGAGAPLVNLTRDMALLSPEGWSMRFPSVIEGRSCSRGLLEWSIRQRLLGSERVRIVDGAAAVGFLASEDRARIAGVRLRPRHGAAGGPDEALPAELVVDATGRGSRLPQWLTELGYPAPRQTVINAFLGYASRSYRVRPDPSREWLALNIREKPPTCLRGGVIFPVERDQWIVTLAGYGKDYPPTEEEGFLAFARSLRSPALYEAIKDAEPLSPIHSTRSSANVLRHYEEMATWPAGLVVTGDAACAFNPVYGQGMTTAALGAALLGDCLRQQRQEAGNVLDGLGQRFQRQLARSNMAAWLLATGADVRVPGAEGPRPGPEAEIMYRYMDRVLRLTTNDPAVGLALTEVLSLLTPPPALLQPWIVARVFCLPAETAPAADQVA